jgi:hypothetical protein
MNHHRPTFQALWPWLIIIAVLILGPILASCGTAAPTATPTPTKTPRPAGPTATASLAPTQEGAVETQPTATVVPVVAAATTAPTAPATATRPAATVPPTPSSVPPTATPRPNAPTAVPGAIAQMTSPDFGVQAFLWWQPEVADRDLSLVKDAGFGWVKQYFAWQDIEGAGKGKFDWSNADRVVEEVQKYNLKLIVRVGADPGRVFWAGNPPENAGAFADFLAAVASRYRGRIQAYQIWNEPNLAREWGNKRPDPTGYVRMLRIAYSTIKGLDPNAIIVTAGMAPTTQDDAIAMPDMRFYQGMYDAMGGQSNGFFDMLGVHGAGYAVSPETDPQVAASDPKLSNNDPSPVNLKRVYAFRHVEDVRGLMVNNGDSAKKIVVLEFGWTSDTRQGSPYYWHGAGAGIDEALKGKYLVRAYQYAAQKWRPWIALMVAIYMPDVKWTKDDEQYWWSIIGPGYPDLYLRPAYVELCIYVNGLNGQRCKYDPNR